MKKYFAIVGKRNNEENHYKILGTGFFIDSKGAFITAGHIFRKNRNFISEFFICFPNRYDEIPLIPIQKYRFISREIYSNKMRVERSRWEKSRNGEEPPQRFQIKHQNGPEYIDVATGICNLEGTPHFNLKKKRPRAGASLQMPCYNKDITTCPNGAFYLRNNMVNSNKFQYSDVEIVVSKQTKPFLARIPLEGDLFEYVTKDYYNNCLEVNADSVRIKGNSGAPILNQYGLVVGMFLGSVENGTSCTMHLSRYVGKVTRKLQKLIKKEN